MPLKYNKNELIKILKSFGKEHISKSDVDNSKYPSSSIFTKYFGSWSEAVKSAGLKTGIITGRPQNPPIVISEKCLEIINGELLGDGTISFDRANACFSHSTANLNYGRYLYDKLKSEVPLLKPEILKERNNSKKQFRTRTTTNKSWTKIRKIWYKDKKIVPNIELTKETCLHWYLGDGYFESCCKISTCGFSYEENCYLAKMLNELGIETFVKEKGKYYILKMSKEGSNNFLNWIGDCPVEGYEHRWGRK